MNKKTCPVCGSTEIIKKSANITFTEPFGGSKIVSSANYTCSKCGAEGDFFEENELLAVDAVAELKQEAVSNILDYFSASEMSFSSIERLLGLPQRTLTKWKNKAVVPHAAGVTLLKFVRIFPWLLKVAEGKYDYDLSQKIHITEGIQQFLSMVQYDEKALINTTIISTRSYAAVIIQAGAVHPAIAAREKQLDIWQQVPIRKPEQRIAYATDIISHL